MFHNKNKQLTILFLLLTIILLKINMSDCRYLPTRSNNSDRLERLREMLKELLESEIEREEYNQQADSPPRWHPESKLFYKREVPPITPSVSN